MSADPLPSGPESELRLAYHRELDELNASVINLGTLVCQTVPRGTEVILEGDLETAQALIDFDDGIDRLSLEVEERCYSLIARQAPTASDLRRIVTVTKVVGELERSADLMINVCKAARRMYGSPISPRCRDIISAMSHEASKLLQMSIESFIDEDASLGAALADIDDTLDQLNRDMVAAIFEAHAADEVDLAAAVQLALVARYYERVGDHAVNIGERVTYMVTGRLPEHDTGELMARMRTVLRHADHEASEDGDDSDGEMAGSRATVVGDISIDPASHEVQIRGTPVRLPLKEFELLSYLMDNAGLVLSRATLIDRVWGHDYVGDTKTLDVHIKRLRAKVEESPSEPTRIVTIRGLGYKFVKPVR
ncbi:MAG: phosphate signaling complex protein PhoU [Actinomycetia bacterium]|nr:phosphate signaling complex protein PhoU [Actinomycetes bacterium]MCP5032328.1 phosphate signaling complex protein PhoU [Actinomycetes bacterium]